MECLSGEEVSGLFSGPETWGTSWINVTVRFGSVFYHPTSVYYNFLVVMIDREELAKTLRIVKGSVKLTQLSTLGVLVNTPSKIVIVVK